MRDVCKSVMGAAGALVFAAGVSAQVGSGGTISDGDAFFTQGAVVTVNTGVGTAGANLTMAGAAGQDQAFQTWWWYRVNGRDTREFCFANATSWNWVGNVGTLTFSDPLFNATITYTVTDPGGTAARVDATLLIENISGAELSIDVFKYLDFDLNGTVGTDSATLIGPNDISITDGPVEGYFRGPGAIAYQVTAFSTVRGLLANTVIDNLNNSGLPFAPADWTGAFQWTASIPAGGNQTFLSIFGTSTPALGRCELAASCTTVSEAACATAGGIWTEGIGLPCIIGSCCVGEVCTVLTASGCAAASGSWTEGGPCPGVTDYSPSMCGDAFEDISGTGTILATVSGCDDCFQTTNLPFSFNFWGSDYGIVSVSSNGYLQFGGTSSIFTNVAIPNAAVPNNIIAANWDDLNTLTAGDIFVETRGDAPNRRFIVQWHNVARHLEAASLHTFQAVLFEGTNDIALRYLSLPPLSGTITPTLGIENSTGTLGYTINQPEVAGGGCRTFTAQVTANPCASSCTADFNNSGAVTVQDIYDFLTDWSSQSTGGPIIIASADFNGVNGVTVQDLYDYFTAWNTQISDPSCN